MRDRLDVQSAPALLRRAMGTSVNSEGAFETQRMRAAVAARLFRPAGKDEVQRIGRFVIERVLGEGGMGVVYAASDPLLGRTVAIKLVRRRGQRRPVSEQRADLLHEARGLARISHPNVVTILDVGMERDLVYIAMEFVEGGTLRQWAESLPRLGRRRVAAVLAVCVPAGFGLAAAHALGIAHRDFKPDNVLVGADGRPRVADFGIADLVGRSESTVEGPPSKARSPGPGTLHYMAPEQLEAAAVDERADQFAYCLTMLELLRGQQLRLGSDGRSIRRAMGHGAVDLAVDESAAPRWLKKVLRRGLSLHREHRFDDMQQLLAAIDRGRRGRAVFAVAFIGALVLASGGLAYWPGDTPKCDDAGAPLGAEWDQEHRRRYAERLDGLGVAAAAEWPALERKVDTKLQTWTEARQQLCRQAARGARSAATLGSARACLRQRADELSTVVGAIATGGLDSIWRVESTLDGLEDPAVCNDAEPADTAWRSGATRAEHHARDEAKRTLAKVRTLLELQRFDEAAALREPLRAATELSDRRVAADAMVVSAVMQWRAGEREGSFTDFETAYFAATEAGADRPAAVAAAWLVFLSGVERSDEAGARAWFRRGKIASRRAGEPAATEFALAHNYATVAIRLAFEDAREIVTAAIDETKQRKDSRPVLVAQLLMVEATWMRAQGETDGAIESTKRALSTLVADVGDRPITANAHHNLANAYLDAARGELALDHFHEALRIRERVLAPGHQRIAAEHSGIGHALELLNRREQSVQHHRTALALLEEGGHRSSLLAAYAQLNLATVLLVDGQAEQALARNLAALEVLERVAPGRPEAILFTVTVAEVELVLGRAASALRRLEALDERWVGNEAVARYSAPLGAVRGRALAAVGRHEEAQPLIEACLRGFADDEGARAQCRVALALGLIEARGDPEAARTHLEVAQAALVDTSGEYAADRALVRALLDRLE